MTNALGESTAVGWDEALGLPVSQTDANGLATRWQYDAFGRWTLSTRSDGTSIRRILANCKSSSCRDDNHRLRVTTQRRDSTGKVYHDQWVDLDRFERPIALGSRLLSGQYSLIVRGYDPLGRISQQSVPCVDGTCDPGHQVVYSYDVLDRPLRITRPYDAANSVPVSVTYAYQGLTTVITDETGADSTQVSDAQGRPVRVIDSLGYAIDYAYDAFGSLSEATDSLGNVLHSNVYNRRGFRTIGFNVDRGSWSFAHNAFGELVAHTDANGHTTTYAYDQLGRPLSRTVPEGSGSITTRWNWGDEAGKHEIGRLVELRIAGSGISDYAETYSYDSFGRSSETRYQEGPDQYYVNQSYSTVTGLPETLTYPRSTDGYRLKLRFAYLHGHLARIEDFADSSTRFWVAESMDAHGVVTQRLLGDAITSRTGIDAVTGRVRTVRAGTSDGTALQKLGYTWDAAGNLLSRSDAIQGVSEEFSYDALHRLVSSSVGRASIQYSYDVFGNLSSKSDVGIYSYDPTRLHQVTQIAQPGAASRSYAYDANGSMTARDSGEILWYSSGLPKRIRARAGSASNSSEFQYTPDGRRWWHRYRYGGGIYTHVDIGGLMEKVTRGSSVDYRHTIYADGRPVAIYSRKSSGDNALRYLLLDHLGSIDVIASSSGAVDLRESFDPFGQRRGENWVAPPASKDISRMRDLTRRGYTGHEHLDSTALIHMNGRVYDPWIGRFLSADPLVDSVFDTQGWNRYSYVRNRPLGFIDPSGYAGKAGRERTIPRNPGIGDALGGSTPNNPGMQLCVMFVCGNPFAYGVSRHGVSSLDTPSPLAQPNLTVYTGHFDNAVNAGTVGNVGSDGGGSRSRATPPSGASAASAAVPTRFADFPSLVAESVVPGYYYAGLAQAHWQTGHYGWAAAYAAASIADAALVVGTFGAGGPAVGTVRSEALAATRGVPFVIGENMTRVNAYARRTGAQSIDDWLGGRQWTPTLNDQFIDAVKAQGRIVIDIGPDFGRRLRNRVDPAFGRPASTIYGRERQQLRDHTDYRSLYERAGEYRGGVSGFDY
jgi:RHS repeat-associated protein